MGTRSLAGIEHSCGHWEEHDMTKWPEDSPRNNLVIWFAMHPCTACRTSKRTTTKREA